MIRHVCNFICQSYSACYTPLSVNQFSSFFPVLQIKKNIFIFVKERWFCVLNCFCLSNCFHYFQVAKSKTLNSLTQHFKIYNMSLKQITSAELEVSYYISTGQFLCDGNSSNNIIEEERSSLYLRQLRYEEYVGDGLLRKREYIQGTERKLCFKVMSYNVLSQQLLDQHRYLYRNQPPSVLRWEYRFPRLLSEIQAEDPDILCLQEVQESHMPFYSKLEEIGYTGVFKKRTGGKVDGCAIYYRTCLFNLIDWTSVEYFQPKVSVLNRDNIGLILRLKVGSGHIVVATTHLLYNPRRHDVRLAQIQLLLAEVHRLANINGQDVGVILTGDLNAKPNSPIVHLITEGTLVHDYPPLPGHLGILSSCIHASEPQLFSSERKTSRSPSPTQAEASLLDSKKSPTKSPTVPERSNTTLTHEFNFHSVYPLSWEQDRVASTYQAEWVNVDYMFYSCCDQLELISRLRLPVVEECESFIKELPNHASPSDHLPLSATFAIRI